MSKFRQDAPARLIEGLEGRRVKVWGGGGAKAVSCKPVGAVAAEEERREEETGGDHGAVQIQ